MVSVKVPRPEEIPFWGQVARTFETAQAIVLFFFALKFATEGVPTDPLLVDFYAFLPSAWLWTSIFVLAALFAFLSQFLTIWVRFAASLLLLSFWAWSLWYLVAASNAALSTFLIIGITIAAALAPVAIVAENIQNERKAIRACDGS